MGLFQADIIPSESVKRTRHTPKVIILFIVWVSLMIYVILSYVCVCIYKNVMEYSLFPEVLRCFVPRKRCIRIDYLMYSRCRFFGKYVTLLISQICEIFLTFHDVDIIGKLSRLFLFVFSLVDFTYIINTLKV